MPSMCGHNFVTTTEAGSSNSTYRVIFPCHWCLHDACVRVPAGATLAASAQPLTSGGICALL